MNASDFTFVETNHWPWSRHQSHCWCNWKSRSHWCVGKYQVSPVIRLSKMTYEQWSEVIDTNLNHYSRSPTRFNKMLEQNSGRIVSISSIMAKSPSVWQNQLPQPPRQVSSALVSVGHKKALNPGWRVNVVAPVIRVLKMVMEVPEKVMEPVHQQAS